MSLLSIDLPIALLQQQQVLLTDDKQLLLQHLFAGAGAASRRHCCGSSQEQQQTEAVQLGADGVVQGEVDSSLATPPAAAAEAAVPAAVVYALVDAVDEVSTAALELLAAALQVTAQSMDGALEAPAGGVQPDQHHPHHHPHQQQQQQQPVLRHWLTRHWLSACVSNDDNRGTYGRAATAEGAEGSVAAAMAAGAPQPAQLWEVLGGKRQQQQQQQQPHRGSQSCDDGSAKASWPATCCSTVAAKGLLMAATGLSKALQTYWW
jgi:hypothetical protein